MIAKIIPRKHGHGSFKNSVNYNLGLSRNDRDKVEYMNMLGIFEPSMAIQEMEALAFENTRSADPVFNCILSWREKEIPSHEQADEAVQIVLRELGLEGCQVHYALHRNTENMHMHICVNRIDPETYKARDPAHGWTKKALEKAARKIELAQGWEIERSGRYVVTPDGQIQEKPNARGGVKLSQTARDIEAHTAEKSAERIAQDTAAPIIREAKSWEELHKRLAEHGIAFEKKGSGAILMVGETIVKASQAGRDISLSKLEKRFGMFCERGCDILPRSPEPVERVKTAPKVQGAWSEYQEKKKDYLKTKKETFAELKIRHRAEREELYKNQRADRSALFAVSWKGRGAELNQRRSVMAARQQGEKLDLIDRQREERERLKKRFPRQFPSFKAWLSMDADTELYVLFRYPGQPVILGVGEEKPFAIGKRHDIRDYSPVSDRKRGGVMYVKNGNSVADFIDYGKKIVFLGQQSEESVTAALQLAARKWGAVQINGSDEYKRLCVEIAAKQGIRIVNPELREAMELLLESAKQTEDYRRKGGWRR